MVSTVSTTKEAFIDVFQYSIKKSNQFTCIGWINQPQFPDDNPIVLLAVSDVAGNVTGVDSALRYEIVKDGVDYRLQFSGSKSKKINKTVGISLGDTNWHFLSYVCTGDGTMFYYVDGVSVPSEDGLSPDSVLYSIAWSRSARQGGGQVWVPYIYKKGQAVSIYNWRFASGIQIHQGWLQQLMVVDKAVLEAA